MDGLMMETGPFRKDGNGGLKRAEASWDEYTTMVFGECLNCLTYHLCLWTPALQSISRQALVSRTQAQTDLCMSCQMLVKWSEPKQR